MFDALFRQINEDYTTQMGGGVPMNKGDDSETVYGECDSCGAYTDLSIVRMVYGNAFFCFNCLNEHNAMEDVN